MPSYSAGSASVSIVPDFRNAQKAMSEWFAKQGDLNIGVRVDTRSLSEQIAAGIRDGLNGAPVEQASTRKGAEAGGAFGDSFQKRLKAALASLPDVKLSADSSDADRAIAALRAELADLSGKKIGIDISDADALAKLADIKARLDNLSADSPSVQVKVDTAAASAQLSAFQAEVDRIDGRDATVDVNVDDHGSFARAASGMSGLAASALALGPALVPISAAVAGGLGAIGPMALAGGAGLGVLALGFSGVADTVKNLGKQHAAVAEEAAKSAGQQSQSAAQIQSAEASLANTRANAADAAIRSSEAIAKAQASEQKAQRDAAAAIASASQALTDARVQGARQVQDATERVAQAEAAASAAVKAALGRQEQAERSLSAAQKSQQQAQQDLTQARKDAAQQLEDLSASVEDNRLSQRQAVLDVADAQAELNKTLADPKATKAQRDQAQLTYDQQVQRQKEVARQGQRLAEQQADATRKGVDGSDLVTAAQQRLIDANQKVVDSTQAVGDAAAAVDAARVQGAANVAKAQQALADTQARSARAVADAQAAVAKAQTDSADRVAAAQQSVADAVRSQTEQQRQSAFAVTQAQAAVAAAMAATGVAGGTALAKINAELAATGSATLTFAGFVRDKLQPAFAGLKDAAANGLLPGVTAGLEAMMPLLPSLTRFVGALAGTMGDLFRQAGQALASPFWVNFFGYVERTASPMLETFAHIIGNLATGFAGLLMAFQPVADQVAGGLLKLSEGFAAFGAGAGTNSGFQSLLSYIQQVGPQVAEVLGKLVLVVVKVVEALAPLGPLALGSIGLMADLILAIPTPVLSLLASIIIPIVTATKLWAIAQSILNAVMEANPIALVALAIVGLVGGVIYAYNNFDTFREVVQKAWDGIQAATSFAWNSVLKPVFQAIGDAATWLWNEALKPAFDGISAGWSTMVTGIQWYWDHILHPVWDVVSEVAKLLLALLVVSIFGPILLAWEGMTSGIQFAWDHVLKPTWDAIASAANWLWTNALSPVFGWITTGWNVLLDGMQWYWDHVLHPMWDAVAAVANWLWVNALSPTFGAIGSGWNTLMTGMQQVWEHVLHPVFDFIAQVILPGLQDAFRHAVDGIGTIWNGLQDIAKAPIKFVVNTVLNDGLIGAFNWVIDKLHLPADWQIGRINLPPGFAEGGRIGGYSPNDRADNIPAMLTAGEFVQPVPAVRKYGGGFMEAVRTGTFPVELAQRFADGGMTWPIMDGIRKRLFPNSVLTSAYRPGANDWHGKGDAIDIGVAGNLQSGLMPIAAKLAQLYPNSTELIHNPNGSIKNGQAVSPAFWGPTTWAQHANHVHWAMANAGMLNGGGGGGLIGTVGDLLGGFGNPLDYIKDKVNGLLGGLKGIGSNRFVDMATGVPGRLLDGVGQFLKDRASAVAAAIGNALASAGGAVADTLGFGDTDPADVSKSGVKGLVQKMFETKGWGSGAQWAAADWVIDHESGWNPKAQNPTSSASGLGQFIDATWRAYRGGSPQAHMKDASIPGQAQAIVRYMADRYGDPIATKRWWEVHHSYNAGGPVYGFANGGRVPGSGAPDSVAALLSPNERVLTPPQDDYLRRFVNVTEHGAGQVPMWKFYLGNREITDLVDARLEYRDAGEQMQARQTLAAVLG